jgi:sulfotransferase famil protein
MICHELKCIFVHIPKTAGQSIEAWFMHHLGLPESQRDSLLLSKNRDPQLGPPRLSHLKAAEYLSAGHISPEQFQAYYKFSFVRNPWDRLVSFYKYRGHAHRYDFKTFVFKHLPKPGWTNDYCHVTPQYDFLYEDERCLVDFVGKFESLQADFDKVCLALGLPPGELPHANKSLQRHTVASVLTGERRKIVRNLKRILLRGRAARNTFGHYSEYYDAETRDFVAELYRKDIEAFGYQFASNSAKSR